MIATDEIESPSTDYDQDYQDPKFDLPWRQFDWSGILYVNALPWLNKDNVILDLGLCLLVH